MSYLQSAFEAVCKEAKPPESWYVCLIEEVRAYGGPEEGGWWYSITSLEAFQEYPTEEQAREAADRVQTLANELTHEARDEHGNMCLRQMEWLDARGLEADFLPEDDGPADYRVRVLNELPQYDNSRPQYC